MSQEKLGEALGLIFQQLQNYERGASPICAGRLFDIARELDAPIPYFFADLADADTAQGANASGQPGTALTGTGVLKGFQSGDPKTPIRVDALTLLFNKHFDGLGRTGQLDASPKDCEKVAGSAHSWVAFRYVRRKHLTGNQ